MPTARLPADWEGIAISARPAPRRADSSEVFGPETSADEPTGRPSRPMTSADEPSGPPFRPKTSRGGEASGRNSMCVAPPAALTRRTALRPRLARPAPRTQRRGSLITP